MLQSCFYTKGLPGRSSQSQHCPTFHATPSCLPFHTPSPDMSGTLKEETTGWPAAAATGPGLFHIFLGYDSDGCIHAVLYEGCEYAIQAIEEETPMFRELQLLLQQLDHCIKRETAKTPTTKGTVCAVHFPALQSRPFCAG